MHVVQIVLVIVVIGLSAARMLMKNAPRGRSTTIGLGMVSYLGCLILFKVDFLGCQISHHYPVPAPHRAR